MKIIKRGILPEEKVPIKSLKHLKELTSNKFTINVTCYNCDTEFECVPGDTEYVQEKAVCLQSEGNLVLNVVCPVCKESKTMYIDRRTYKIK